MDAVRDQAPIRLELFGAVRWIEARLEPIGLHELRHTYVSLMHASGSTLEEIGDYVGPLVDVHDRPLPAPARGPGAGGGRPL
jgi:hypothetical protein